MLVSEGGVGSVVGVDLDEIGDLARSNRVCMEEPDGRWRSIVRSVATSRGEAVFAGIGKEPMLDC